MNAVEWKLSLLVLQSKADQKDNTGKGLSLLFHQPFTFLLVSVDSETAENIWVL